MSEILENEISKIKSDQTGKLNLDKKSLKGATQLAKVAQ